MCSCLMWGLHNILHRACFFSWQLKAATGHRRYEGFLLPCDQASQPHELLSVITLLPPSTPRSKNHISTTIQQFAVHICGRCIGRTPSRIHKPLLHASRVTSMSSHGEAAAQEELPNSAPASPSARRLLGVNDIGEPSGPEALGDKHTSICNADKEPPTDEISADQRTAETSSSEHRAVAFESQKRSPDLCGYCRKIVDNLPYHGWDELVVEHHGTVTELFDSARAGCIICTHLSEFGNPYPCELRLEDGCWKLGIYGPSLPAASSESRPPGIASSRKVYRAAYECYDIRHLIPAPEQEARVSDAMQCHYQARYLVLHPYKGTMERFCV